MHTEPAADQRRSNLVQFLSARSGYYTAEAVGVLAMKVLCLVIAGLLVPALPEIFADGLFSALLLGTVVVLAIIALVCTALFGYTDLVVDRLRPSHRFYRLAEPRQRRHTSNDSTSAPSAPRRVLTVALLLLSLPVLFVLAHMLSAYAVQLTSGGSFDWSAWNYSGFALEPLFFLVNGWPLLVLAVLVVSLVCLVFLLARGIRAAIRRLRASPRTRRGGEAEHEPPPELPERVLRSRPEGQRGLFLATGFFLLLGLPSLYIVGYALLAYLRQLWRILLIPSADSWYWDAPSNLGAFGEWFFRDDALIFRILAPTLSAVALIAGIALATLAVPLLTRRGVDAIDLAVTESGVITRGNLAIGWDEVAEVLIVEDVRASSRTAERSYRGLRLPHTVVNLTYLAAHSRTRVALLLRDLPGVAARATRSQRRGLRADARSTHGYALCDLWVHPEGKVQASLTQLVAGAEVAHVPVTELRRARAGSVPQLLPSSFAASLAGK